MNPWFRYDYARYYPFGYITEYPDSAVVFYGIYGRTNYCQWMIPGTYDDN